MTDEEKAAYELGYREGGNSTRFDLLADNERLREALFRIKLLPDQATVQSAKNIARAALEAKP